MKLKQNKLNLLIIINVFFRHYKVEDVVQTVKVLQQIKGFEEEDLPVPDYDTDKELQAFNLQQQEQHYASKMDAYNYHEANFSHVRGTRKELAALYGNSMVSNNNYSQSNYPYPRQHRLLKSQILNGGKIESSHNIDKLCDGDGATSVYVPVGGNNNNNNNSIQTYNSNYFQCKYRNLKKSSYNKSLDVVFRRRWHALSQGKGNQIKNKPRVKVNDIFIHQVSSNIQSVQRNSKPSVSGSVEHTIHIDEL